MRDLAGPQAIDAGRAEKPVKTLFGWLLFRRISLPISLRLARTRIRPWHLTALGLFSGLGAGALLGTGRRPALVAGGLLALVAKLFDAMDGEVARAKHLDTSRGYVVDGLCDRLRDVAMLVGAGIGAYRTGNVVALEWTIGAVAGYLGFFYVSAAAPAHWREIRSGEDLEAKHMFRLGKIRLGAGDTLAVAVLIAALTGHLLWLEIAVAVASPAAIALKLRSLFALRPWER